MDSRERVTRAIKLQGVDRAPIMHRTLPGAFRDYGQSLADLYARYPSDVLLSPVSRSHFGFRRSVGEGSGKFRMVTDAWGCVWDSLSDDYLGQVVGNPLSDWDQFPSYRLPEPTLGIEGVEHMVEAAQADGRQHYVLVYVGSLWHQTNWLRGFENSLIDVLEDRPELYELRDRLTDFLIKRVELLYDRRDYVDGVLINDDWGTQQTLMVKPPYWRKVYKPAYARIVAAIHQAGFLAHLHTDGVTEAIIEDLIEVGFDELNPQTSCMDPDDLGRRFGGRVCFRADVDRQYTLPFGTPAEVEAHVRRLHAAFGSPRGGYVGYGQVGTDVPLANAEAMLRTFGSFVY